MPPEISRVVRVKLCYAGLTLNSAIKALLLPIDKMNGKFQNTIVCCAFIVFVWFKILALFSLFFYVINVVALRLILGWI